MNRYKYKSRQLPGPSVEETFSSASKLLSVFFCRDLALLIFTTLLAFSKDLIQYRDSVPAPWTNLLIAHATSITIQLKHIINIMPKLSFELLISIFVYQSYT